MNKAFLTFGLGPRNCIGSLLAVTNARAVLSAIVLRYKVELAEEETKKDLDPETGLRKLIVYTGTNVYPAKSILIKLTPIA